MELDYKRAIQELIRQGKATDREDRERAERMATLLKHAGFSDFLALLNKKAEELGAELLSPALSLDGMVRTEFQKGAMFGLILARDLVTLTVEIDKEARKSETAEGDIE